MSTIRRPIRRAALLALGATLLLAGPAAAHPFVQGGEAPVDSRAQLTLQMAHGCLTDDQADGHSHGEEDEGDGDPTIEVAMEVPASVRILDAPEVDGYEPAFERADDGRIEVVTWTATDGGEPAPDLPFEAVFEGEPGDELYLKVFQACDDFTYRWVGTPDEPADDPAIRVTLVAADADNPAPEPGEAPADADETYAPNGDEGTDTDAEAGADGEEALAGSDEAGTEVTEEAPAEDAAAEEAPDAAEETGDPAAAVADDEGGSALPWVIAGVVALALVAGVVPLVLKRRTAGDDRATP